MVNRVLEKELVYANYLIVLVIQSETNIMNFFKKVPMLKCLSQ